MAAQCSEPRLQVSRVPQRHVGVVGTRGEHSSVQKPEENTNFDYSDVYTKKLAENKTLIRIQYILNRANLVKSKYQNIRGRFVFQLFQLLQTFG